MTGNVRVVCTDSPGPCFGIAAVLTADKVKDRFFVNAPEGTQRFCVEGGLKIVGINGVYLTRIDPSAISGLPGLLLTAADSGTGPGEVHVFGPPSWTASYFASIQAFFYRPSLPLVIHDTFSRALHGTGAYRAIPYPTGRHGGLHGAPSSRPPLSAPPAPHVVSWVFLPAPKRGTFLPSAARRLGVTNVKSFGVLKGGVPVQSDASPSTIVHPADVMSPDVPGAPFAVLDIADSATLHRLYRLTSAEIASCRDTRRAVVSPWCECNHGVADPLDASAPLCGRCFRPLASPLFSGGDVPSAAAPASSSAAPPPSASPRVPPPLSLARALARCTMVYHVGPASVLCSPLYAHLISSLAALSGASHRTTAAAATAAGVPDVPERSATPPTAPPSAVSHVYVDGVPLAAGVPTYHVAIQSVRLAWASVWAGRTDSPTILPPPHRHPHPQSRWCMTAPLTLPRPSTVFVGSDTLTAALAAAAVAPREAPPFAVPDHSVYAGCDDSGSGPLADAACTMPAPPGVCDDGADSGDGMAVQVGTVGATAALVGIVYPARPGETRTPSPTPATSPPDAAAGAASHGHLATGAPPVAPPWVGVVRLPVRALVGPARGCVRRRRCASAAGSTEPPPVATPPRTPRSPLPPPPIASLQRDNDIWCTDALTFLGTGASLPSKYRNVTGNIVVQQCPQARGGSRFHNVLLDGGEGSLGQLLRAGATHSVLRCIDAIFISHVHADHHLGVPLIAAARADAGASVPLIIVAPSCMAPFLSESPALRAAGLRVHVLPPGPSQAGTLTAESVAAHGGCAVCARHAAITPPPGVLISSSGSSPVDAYDVIVSVAPDCSAPTRAGHASWFPVLRTVTVPHCFDAHAAILYRPNAALLGAAPLVPTGAACGGVTAPPVIAFSGDSMAPCAALADAARHVAIMVHEATFGVGVEADALAAAKRHSTVAGAVETSRMAAARAVLLTHFSQRFPKAPPPADSAVPTGTTGSLSQPSPSEGDGAPPSAPPLPSPPIATAFDLLRVPLQDPVAAVSNLVANGPVWETVCETHASSSSSGGASASGQ